MDKDEARAVTLGRASTGWTLDAGDGAQSLSFTWHTSGAPAASASQRLRVALGGRDYTATVVLHHDAAHVFQDGEHHTLLLRDTLAHAGGHQGEHGADMTAPMPGKVIAITVAVGDTVAKGQPLLVMEAMKMEHTIAAAADGEVQEIFYAIGDQVGEGATLIALK
jgi:3-methylcrotonyl-CoA carboxylase alpha subunit